MLNSKAYVLVTRPIDRDPHSSLAVNDIAGSAARLKYQLDGMSQQTAIDRIPKRRPRKSRYLNRYIPAAGS